MSQSRRLSMVETLINVVVGYLVAVGLQLLVFPAYGLSISLADNLRIGIVFTFGSIARGYALRRVFNAMAERDQ